MADTAFRCKCDVCGGYLAATSREYICCPRGCGRLIPRPKRYKMRLRAVRKQDWKQSLPLVSQMFRVKRMRRFTLVGRQAHYRRASRAERIAPKRQVVVANWCGRVVYLVEVEDE